MSSLAKLERLANQIDIYLNSKLVATGVGRERGPDWYLYFLKKGVTTFFGVTVCIEHGQIFCSHKHMNDDTCEDLMVTHQVCIHGFVEEEILAASEATSEQQDEDAESIYTAEDYLEGAVERLTELGHVSQAQQVLDIYGQDLGSSGDPVSVLIALEEGAKRHDKG